MARRNELGGAVAMSYRVQCSACAKLMTVEDDAEGELLVCVACGTRLVAPPAPVVQTMEADGGESGSDATEVPPPTATAAPAPVAKPRPTLPPRDNRSTLIAGAAAVAVVVIATLIGALVVNRNG